MKKWNFLAFGIIGMMLLPALAPAATFKEKIHYERVQPAVPSSVEGKVEVVEMFWYGCPHCYNLEPHVKRWLKRKPKNAEFVRIPAIFGRPDWVLHARAYYTAEVLGVLDKTHEAMFDAIHGQKKHLNTEDDILKLFIQHGVTEQDFKRVFKSFAVEAKVRRAKDLSQRYGIKGVPALVVNGKYRTGSQLAGGNAKIFQVVNQLVKEETK